MSHLTEDDFEEKYTLSEDLPCDCFSEGSGRFETFGADLETVKAVLATNPKRVWTLVNGDEHDWIVAGYRVVNRESYIITDEDYESEEEEYQREEIVMDN